ncbi:DUF2653 family protein [Neobacillus ginsengisoli]|uniref:DUF2653 family protein n=1 Tax=Neobacillus ginsengisoli TaxID=904295 RepID=A0ABT9Y347_9BACI|nr:DUF2653 family protein [Neobacillus ginsengisoli]MDQ0202233.1 hypothetical protein [Neobacillus ginsengisoli]
MKLLFNEQDVIDACCVIAAQRINGKPEEIDVDLQFNPTTGFEANARDMNRGFQTIHLTEQNIIDGIIVYLSDYHNFIPERLKVNLEFNKGTGIEAVIVSL